MRPGMRRARVGGDSRLVWRLIHNVLVPSLYIGPQNVLQEREAGSGAPDTGQESRTPKGGDPGQLGFS